MIDRFTRQEFEDALPTHNQTGEPLWESMGFDKGEYVYRVPIQGHRTAIQVRSSVGRDNVAKGSGQDSIRLYLVHSKTGKPLAEKVDAWTQRTTGWQDRMISKIRTLYQKGKEMVGCPKCNGVLSKREGKFGVFYGCSNYPKCRYTANDLNKVPRTPQKPEPEPEAENEPEDDVDYAAVFEALETEISDDLAESTESYAPVENKDIQLNEQQRAFVEAPVDADVRVMAGPGSGKTTSVVERIHYLVQNGVDPDAIVYVTLTRSMADEGKMRILNALPELASSRITKQICTMHALCLRILREEGVEREVLPGWDWRLEKALADMIEGNRKEKIKGEWQYDLEQPGWKEVLYWIENAKGNGLRSVEDMSLFGRALPYQHAEKVHRARKRFDKWMIDHGFIRFADMFFAVEQHLMRDITFRNRWQARFTHVLCDEGQDVNAQALRILITLSLSPGDNRVYNEWLSRLDI